MSRSVLYMSMSLDGFIAGPDDGPDQGLGRDGEILHSWLGSGGSGVGSFRPSDPGDHHGVPIFVPTHQAPVDQATHGPWVSYVTDGIESAMAQAKAAAGEANVLVHGAETAQRALTAGLLDELEIHLIPVLFGEGRRLFDHLGTDHIELDLIRIIDARGVTHFRYRVQSTETTKERP